MDKESHRCLDFHSIVDITEPDQHPRPHTRPSFHRFLLVTARFSSGSSLEFAVALGSRMNPNVKLKQVEEFSFGNLWRECYPSHTELPEKPGG